ncbi:MAG: DUF192 domain-containing protein [Negativicutes bacterium]
MNQTRQTVMAENLRIADTFFNRLKGLLGTSVLPAGEALLIRPCNNIHMFGMKYSIDVAFVDDTDQVLKTVEALHPGRFACCSEALYVVEMPCGTLLATGTAIGDSLKVIAEQV